MPVHDDLGNRMKKNYENITKICLVRRTPVIIRIDGKAFHTFTRGFNKPFDKILIQSMQETMKYLCENIQGAVLGYHQSDEISIALVDYKKLDSCAWFDYEVQKMCSISASMTTMYFNSIFMEKVMAEIDNMSRKSMYIDSEDKYMAYIRKLKQAVDKGAMFDSRVFNIPKEEVTNYFYWRQLDATRNSIQMVGQAHFSHKQLEKKTCNMIQDMLHEQKGINWNDFPIHQKRGSCAIKTEDAGWILDNEIPIFKGEDREYIDKLIYVGEQ